MNATASGKRSPGHALPEMRSAQEMRGEERDPGVAWRDDTHQGRLFPCKHPLVACDEQIRPGAGCSRDQARVAVAAGAAGVPERKQAGKVWFVSRHPGAVEWAARKGLAIECWIAHLNVAEVRPGDIVIGTLPVNLAAEVCRRGARYFSLSLDLPASVRGRELMAEELIRYGARVEEYCVMNTR